MSFFLSFQYSHLSLAVLELKMFVLDILLYFHSCGIVGIMMVVIKSAHILLFMNCMLNVSFGF